MENPRVLVVDDEADFLETIIKRLKKRSITTYGVPSGEEALSLMNERPVDVVLLDMKMPGGMDGIRAFREMKKIQPLAEVIFLTGHATLESSIEGMKLGAFDFLVKPVKLDELLSVMGAALEKKNAHEEKIRKRATQASSGDRR